MTPSSVSAMTSCSGTRAGETAADMAGRQPGNGGGGKGMRPLQESPRAPVTQKVCHLSNSLGTEEIACELHATIDIHEDDVQDTFTFHRPPLSTGRQHHQAESLCSSSDPAAHLLQPRSTPLSRQLRLNQHLVLWPSSVGGRRWRGRPSLVGRSESDSQFSIRQR